MGEEEIAIRKHFGKCGEIAEIDLPNKLAFITFKSEEAVQKALDLDGKAFGAGSEGLKVRRAIEKKGGGKAAPKAKAKGEGKEGKEGKGKGKSKDGKGKGKGKGGQRKDGKGKRQGHKG